MGTEVTAATFHLRGNIPVVSRPGFGHMGTLRKPVCLSCDGSVQAVAAQSTPASLSPLVCQSEALLAENG